MISSTAVVCTVKNITYGGFKISSLLWGFWLGTYGYTRCISFLQFKKYNIKENKKYEINGSGLFVSGIIGSYIVWNIF